VFINLREMTWRAWERETMAVAIAEEGCNRGVLFGLTRAWPASIGSCHGKTEIEEDTGDATEEETSTSGATEGEATVG
jgi:hypothetical protein